MSCKSDILTFNQLLKLVNSNEGLTCAFTEDLNLLPDFLFAPVYSSINQFTGRNTRYSLDCSRLFDLTSGDIVVGERKSDVAAGAISQGFRPIAPEWTRLRRFDQRRAAFPAHHMALNKE